MSEAVLCPQCGAKVRGDRPRCPRCRAFIAPVVDAAASARSSRRLVRVSAGLALAFGLIVGGLWLTAPGDVPKAPKPSAANPLASRHSAATQATPPAAPAPAVDPAERPFLEPSGAGAVAYSAGDLPSSLARFKEAVEKNPEDAESWSNMGQVLVKLERAEEALPAFAKASALVPNRWAYRFNQARALSLLGRLDESVAAYRAAQQLFPNDYVTAFNLALTLHKQGNDAAAVDEYKKAIALSPEDPSFQMALALSYERLQRPADAAAAYAEALRLSPAAPDADRVRARIAQLTGQPAANGPAPAGSGQ